MENKKILKKSIRKKKGGHHEIYVFPLIAFYSYMNKMSKKTKNKNKLIIKKKKSKNKKFKNRKSKKRKFN